MNKIKTGSLKLNPNNPREITPEKFDSLKKSIKDFPKMMELRPMVVDVGGVVLGGNMRLRAIQALGYDEIPEAWVKRADELTQEEQRRFLAVDNLEFGTWTDEFANEFDLPELAEWGFDEKDLGIKFSRQNWKEIRKIEEEKRTADLKEKQKLREKMLEDNPDLVAWIKKREAAQARGEDQGEVNFWLCLVFQSWAQKQEFIEQFPGLETIYGMYVDGERFASLVKKDITLNTQKPIKTRLDKKLVELVK